MAKRIAKGIDPTSKKVIISCDVKERLPLDKFLILQGKLKELTEERYLKLKQSIIEHGFFAPMFIWVDDKQRHNLTDGTQRSLTLKRMRDEEGYEIPELPYVKIFAKNKADAKKKILLISSQFGRITGDGLYEYIMADELDYADMLKNVDIAGFNQDDFIKEFFDDTHIDQEENDDIYTNKIEAPVYTPKGDKPKLSDLYDLTKTNQLMNEIDKSNQPDEVKNFLKFAAYRHTVFNYAKIAEYYCHSDVEAQNLMEKSALIIIDFNKAIENGFVRLTKEIAEASDE